MQQKVFGPIHFLEVSSRDGPIPYFCRYADMPISASADIADTDTAATFSDCRYDTADTEKCADMPIFPIPILVSAHP